MIGTLGDVLLLAALVASLAGTATFFLAARSARGARRWMPVAKGAWLAMTAAVVAAAGVLWWLLLTHHYEYAYVYRNTSNAQPLKYLISAFWGGQEGSFMLWILTTTAVGSAFLWLAPRRWRPTVMTVVAGSQFFLLSMVVGLDLGVVKIGASPFATLAEAMPEAPIFQQNPGFVPADGTGLNDLLQNPWMVIHPPILFTGFALMLIPFAFAVAALWKKRYTSWVKPALPWTLFGVMILGAAIAMGGYWAYVTLNFGGYWAWDPVENASLVPWLVGIAALHTMLVQKKSERAHKASLGLSVSAFMLVVYESFLTRSGILGDSSVHSFVDLGLYNQLLIWMVLAGAVGFGLLAWRWRDLPVPEGEARPLSREFMMFSGALLLCALAAVVTVGTSSPILGRLFRNSPSGVPVEFYNRWTLPLALGVVFLAGLGQLFWWNRMTVESLNRVLIKPIAGAVAATVAVLIFTPFAEETVASVPAGGGAGEVAQAAGFLSGLGLGSLGLGSLGLGGVTGSLSTFWTAYGQGLLLILLVFAAFFALFGNGLVMWRIGRGNPKMAGGAFSHVGFALAMLGIVASSAFSDPIAPRSLNEAGEERTAFVAAKGRAQKVDGYTVTYEGKETNERGRGVYVLNFETPGGETFTLRPVAYQGGGKQWFLQPDTKNFFSKDVYASVTPREATGQQNAEGGEITLARGERRTLGTDRFDVRFDGFATEVPPSKMPDSTKVAVAARLNVTNRRTGESRRLEPLYLIMTDNTERYGQVKIKDWGLTLTFTGMNVDSGAARLAIEGVQVMPDDWLVVQAKEKPLIGILWAGILTLSLGFGLAMYRRTRELAFSEDRRAKEEEA